MKVSNKIGLFFIIVAILLVIVIITLSTMFTDAKKAELIQEERFKFYELVVQHKQNTDYFTDIFITYINTNDQKYRQKLDNVLNKEDYSNKKIRDYRNDILKAFKYPVVSSISDVRKLELKIFLQKIKVPQSKFDKLFEVDDKIKELLSLEFEAINALRGYAMDKNGDFTVKVPASDKYASALLLSEEYRNLKKEINGSIDYLFGEIDLYVEMYIKQLEREENIAYKFSIVITMILLLVVFISYFNFKNSIVNPLEKLALWIEQMKENKTIEKEISFQKDEIGIVMNSFINMADTIKKDMEELESLSTTDILTKLKNRVTLDKVLGEAHYNVNRYLTPYSVIMIDIDYFKEVNDKYGHIIGDVILKEFASILSKEVRMSDTLGRWGGEEFLIICANTNINGACILAEKLRKCVEDFEFTRVEHKTASFGVADFEYADTIEEVLEKADQALYEAKENGRNLVKFK
ncbi:GGDEF domain-containing protein [Poseidonibacter lekithochrous]|uniref:sensor domain-containing diguanylate cyclase n=1 Tax=Poseidonibacter lekithochrous TaxID=1904463 RepID=UPI0008FC7ADB|nr:GGDEF domain-containing protein [Poseidonibacter lekithochrous]QKJ21361.1 diguanylate cyclase [Poseidonibacter lekithochrous]